MQEIKNSLLKYMDNLLERYPILSTCKEDIISSFIILSNCFTEGRKLLIAGNGGSAADAEHIVGELMKGFCLPRKVSDNLSEALCQVDKERGTELSVKLQSALPAIALNNHSALNTAFLNDVNGYMFYAQQIMGYGSCGDVFLGISTSGNSKNVVYAAITAKAKGLKVLGLTGKDGGELKHFADICIKVDETEVYKIQELHLPIYHCLCLMLEAYFYG